MKTEDEGHLLSPLSQHVERDGHSVRIDIYGDGTGSWILEVVDEYNNSTVWDDAFETDQFALDAAMDAINSEGIRSLIGPQPGDRT
jgi:hypothetical protein